MLFRFLLERLVYLKMYSILYRLCIVNFYSLFPQYINFKLSQSKKIRKKPILFHSPFREQHSFPQCLSLMNILALKQTLETLILSILNRNYYLSVTAQMITNNQPIILVYYNFKGMGQVARHLLTYLNIQFVDICLDILQVQKKTLPSSVFQTLKGRRIDKTILPVLIHEGLAIQQLFPIMTYLCYRYQRQDLLGKDIYQKARVQQLMQIYMNSLPQTKGILFQLADTSAVIEEQDLLKTIESYYKRVLSQSLYMKQLCQFIVHEGERQFILGNLTIVDFYFFQSTNYMLGLFGGLDKKISNQKWKATSQKLTRKIRGITYLRIMNDYQQFMLNQSYYRTHQKYLQAFSVVGSLTSPKRKSGFKRLWATNMSQFKDQ